MSQLTPRVLDLLPAYRLTPVPAQAFTHHLFGDVPTTGVLDHRTLSGSGAVATVATGVAWTLRGGAYAGTLLTLSTGGLLLLDHRHDDRLDWVGARLGSGLEPTPAHAALLTDTTHAVDLRALLRRQLPGAGDDQYARIQTMLETYTDRHGVHPLADEAAIAQVVRGGGGTLRGFDVLVLEHRWGTGAGASVPALDPLTA